MILTISTYVGVFLLGFQQQNVQHGYYIWAGITSACIALTQYLIITNVVNSGAWAILEMAIGGSAGITTSMYVHRRWVKK